jgi:hypothetical protein
MLITFWQLCAPLPLLPKFSNLSIPIKMVSSHMFNISKSLRNTSARELTTRNLNQKFIAVDPKTEVEPMELMEPMESME